MQQEEFCKYCKVSGGDHETCIAVMEDKIPKISRISARLALPYFKQGDDLFTNLVKKTDGTIDLVQSLNAHAENLEAAVYQLKNAANVLEEEKEKKTKE